MTDNRLLELAERVEAATAEQQREMLLEVWWLLSGMADSRNRGLAAIDSRFERMLDAEAYESAAMSLVPEGFRLERLADTTPTIQSWQTGPWVAHLVTDGWPRPRPRRYGSSEHGSSPALALVAAALRTRANGEGL